MKFDRTPRTLLVALAIILVIGCSDDPAPVPELPAATALDAPQADALAHALAEITPLTTAELWARSCAFCHATGNAGAPRFGNAQEWQEALTQGEDALLAHTLEGLGNMPPLGYCMECTEADFRALIRFMVPAGALTTPGAEP